MVKAEVSACKRADLVSPADGKNDTMITTNDTTLEFVNHVISAAERMPSGPERRRLLALASGRRPGTGLPSLGSESIDDLIERGVTRCLSDHRYFTLATLAACSNAEHLLPGLLEGMWPGNFNFLAHTGRLLAFGTRAELDEVVETVSAEHWAPFGIHNDAQDVPYSASRKIAGVCDEFAYLNPAWPDEAETAFDERLTAAVEIGKDVGPWTFPEVETAFEGQLGRADTFIPEAEVIGESNDIELLSSIAELSGDDTFRMIPMSAFLERPLPARPLVFGPMLERGLVTVLGAAPGIGKSTLTAAISTCVALGRDLAGFEVPEPVRVWHMNTEDSSDETQRRFTAFAKHNSIRQSELDNLFAPVFGRKLRLMNKLSGTPQPSDQGTALRKAIVRQRLGLLVLDPLVLLHDLDENSNADMGAFLEFLQETAREANCAILLVHHARKDKSGQSMDALRGASAIAASARSVYTLWEEDGRNEVTLTCVKSNNHSRASQSVTFERQSVTLDNGDQVGVLVPCNTVVATAGTPVRRRSQ